MQKEKEENKDTRTKNGWEKEPAEPKFKEGCWTVSL